MIQNVRVVVIAQLFALSFVLKSFKEDVVKRIIGLDIGDNRIGVSVSDALNLTAQPVGVIQRKGWRPDTKKLREIADRWDTDILLCGLPKNMDGSEGFQAQKVREMAEYLSGCGFTVIFQDERLSTVAAEKSLNESGMTHKKQRTVVDCTAAVIILQNYLDFLYLQKNKGQEDREND